MDQKLVIGVVASILTALASLPQLIKLIKDKKAKDVSPGMFIVLTVGVAFWIYYGTLLKDWIIIISNTVSLIINATTFILSIKYKPKEG